MRARYGQGADKCLMDGTGVLGVQSYAYAENEPALEPARPKERARSPGELLEPLGKF